MKLKFVGITISFQLLDYKPRKLIGTKQSV